MPMDGPSLVAFNGIQVGLVACAAIDIWERGKEAEMYEETGLYSAYFY